MNKVKTLAKRGIVLALGLAAIVYVAITSMRMVFDEYHSGTQVSNVYIGGLEKDKAHLEVMVSVVDYLDNVRFEWYLNNTTMPIELDFVQFNNTDTINLIRNGSKSVLVFNVTRGELKDQIVEYVNPSIAEALDYEKLETDIVSSMTFMAPGQIFNLEDYIIDYESLKVVLSSYTVETIHANEIENIFDDFKIDVNPLERFSLIEALSIKSISVDAANDIATGVNAVVLESPFINIEKTNKRELDDYSSLEVMALNTIINKVQGVDYSFYNPIDQQYEIVAVRNGEDIEFQLIGLPYSYEYTYRINPIEYIEEIGEEFVTTSVVVEVTRNIKRDDFVAFDSVIYSNYYGNLDDTYEG